MTFGTALAFFLGKPFVQPQAAHLPWLPLGEWLGAGPALAAALQINPLFAAGIALAAVMAWGLKNTRLGLVIRTTGDSTAAARAIGISVNGVRFGCTALGSLLAGLGGAFLSLSYPGAWSESLSSGQGLMAVALVIYARWQPLRCVWAAMLFGASGALGSAMQAVGWSGGLYLFNAAPYALTFLLMLGAPGANESPTMHPQNLPPEVDAMPALALKLEGMGKRFGALRALHEVGLEMGAGEFHALLGENGAGKSTLVKCLMGFYRADAGKIFINGEPRNIASPADAHAQGLGMVYQHFTSVPALTAAENLVVSRSDAPQLIDWPRERAAIAAFLSRMPFRVPEDVPVGRLAAGQRQKLEILKQLYLGNRLLILDEPTSVLTPQEASEVLGLLHQMTRRGELSVLMITHKFREVHDYCDRVTVLRQGQVSGRGVVSELDNPTMAQWMVGELASTGEAHARAPVPRSTVPALELIALQAEDERGLPVLSEFNLSLQAGEIVGLAGVSGNGQTALMEVLSGQRQLSHGRVLVNAQQFHPDRRCIEALGLRTLPEEPLKNACVAQMSVAENLCFRGFDQAPLSNRWGWLSPARIRARGRELIKGYQVKCSSPDAPVNSLSGGNVQRAVLARELSGNVRVLVISNPCFGLDFASTARIRAELLEQRRRGTAVLLISEDLDEILELSDRVAVISGGHVAFEQDTATADRMLIGLRMGGAAHSPE